MQLDLLRRCLREMTALSAALKVAFQVSHYSGNIAKYGQAKFRNLILHHVDSIGDLDSLQHATLLVTCEVRIFCSSPSVISNERTERENLRADLWSLFPFLPVGLSSQSRCALAALGTSTSCLDWAIRDSTVTSSLHSHISNLSVPCMTV